MPNSEPYRLSAADLARRIDEGELTAGFNCLALTVVGVDRPIPLPPGTILPKDAGVTTLALRPEKLQLWRERPAGFAVRATVSSVGYLGGASIVHLTAGEGLALKARLPSSAAGCFSRGTAVWATWSPDDGVVIAQ